MDTPQIPPDPPSRSLESGPASEGNPRAGYPENQENEVEVLFHAALELPKAARASYLHAACGENHALLERVQGLLSSLERDEDFMEAGAERVTGTDRPFAFLRPEEVGDRIGNYKLLEQIGEGGFGTVWVAEQERPVRRRVALKVIKLGMDTKEVIARFEQERQALAVMDHPNVAKVFDAGATQFGRPFFAMELVQGARITDYCDQVGMGVQGRLQLFMAVCNAVQHAHQKGIIHRDIKPSNVLVATQEGKPVPKVIDFGVAKAIGERLTDMTICTGVEQPIGTPAYMSPEQVDMKSENVDTRTDVYSLGVLLYELLTGRTPFDRATLLQRGYDEMRRIVREVDPPKPTGAMRSMTKEKLQEVASLRGIEPGKLVHAISGDLEWIVMKSIEKERERRYGTANGLAADIQRYLADEPVSAGPPNAGYKFRKFARRNKVAIRVAAAILLILLAGITTSTVLYVRERSALDRESVQRGRAEHSEKLAKQKAADESAAHAQADAARVEAEAMTQFLFNVFASAQPLVRGREVTVVESLANALERIQIELANHPEQKHKLQGAIVSVMHGLGRTKDTISFAEETRDYYAAHRNPEHMDALRAHHAVARYYMSLKRWTDAKEILERIYEIEQRILPPEHSEHGELMQAMSDLSACDFELGFKDKALAIREKAHEAGLAGKYDADHIAMVRAKEGLAASYHDARLFEKALKLRWEALASRRKELKAKEPGLYVSAADRTAETLEALELFEESLKLRMEVVNFRKEKFMAYAPLDYLGAVERAAKTFDALNRSEEASSLRAHAAGVKVMPIVKLTRGGLFTDPGYRGEILAIAALLTQRRADEAIARTRALMKMHPEPLTPPKGYAAAEAWLANALLAKAAWEGGQNRDGATDAAREAEEIIQGMSASKWDFGTAMAAVDLLMCYGHWQAATKLGRELFVQVQGNPFTIFRYGPLLLKGGDIKTYEQVCDEVLRPYTSATPAELKELYATFQGHAEDIIARVVCLRQPSDANLKWAVKLADEAMKQEKSPHRLVFVMARALVAYREDDFGKAVSLLEPSILRMPPVTATDANAILAMAKHRMGQTQGAREALERGAKLFDAAWFSKDRVAIRDSVADWLIADILLREAKSVVDGK